MSIPFRFCRSEFQAHLSIRYRIGLAVCVALVLGIGQIFAQSVAAPQFSPSEGWLPAVMRVTVTCTTPSTTIYYTTDGTDPTQIDPVVSGSTVELRTSGTLKARAWNTTGQFSAVTTGIYDLSGMVSAGVTHTAALSTSGSTAAWGDQTNGKLGNGATAAAIVANPVALKKSGPADFTDAVEVSAGENHTLILARSGTTTAVWAVGANNVSQLGTGTSASQSRAVQVLGPSGTGTLINIDRISAGSDFSLALEKYATSGTWGRVYSWGQGGGGRLGNGASTDSAYPQFVKKLETNSPALDSVVDISAGKNFGVAVQQTGTSPSTWTVWSWGNNASGQLGQSDTTNRDRAKQVLEWISFSQQPVLDGMVAVSAGEDHVLAIRSGTVTSGTFNGAVYAWGEQQYGAMGNGETAAQAKKYAFRVEKDAAFGGGYLDGIVQVDAGAHISLALDGDGKVWAFGRNNTGAVGSGTGNQPRAIRLNVTGTGSNAPIVTWISAGGTDTGFCLAVDENGKIYAWGNNASGMLGTGTTTNLSVPTWSATQIGVVNRPPSGTLSIDGEPFTAPATVTLTGNVSDPDGNIARVDFYQNSALLFSDTGSPYTTTINGLASGTYSFSAKVYDAVNAGATLGPIPQVIMLPVVSVTGTPATILENSGSSATFRISRAPGENLTNPLTVNFTLTGSALNGGDYTVVNPQTATIASGSQSVNVAIQPINDAYVEGSENVLMTLTTSATSYNIQTGTATITITESLPGWIGKISGDSQVGATSAYLDNPLVVEVRSGSGGTLLINAPVTFTVASGSGNLATSFGGTVTSGTLSVTTGTNGRAQAWYKQGSTVAVTSTITAVSGSATAVSFTSQTASALWSRWKLNEGTGVTAAEASGLGGSGTLANGPVWTTGYNGEGALAFTASNSYVTMGSPAGRTLDLGAGSFMLAFWVKYTEAAGVGETRRIVGKGLDGWGAGYFVGLRGDGKLALGVGSTTGAQADALLVKTTGTYNTGEWRHVAAVIDREAGTAKIYVDGAASALEKEAGTGGTVSGTSASISALTNLSASGTGTPFTVASQSGTTAFFKGQIDDVQVHREALGGTQVLADYNVSEDPGSTADTMPDRWEWQYFGNLNQVDGSDYDGDGLTNLQEYQQGSDPKDYYNGTLPTVQKVSGDGQAGESGSVLPNPLVVQVLTSGSVPLNAAPVSFSISGSYGQIASSGTGTFGATANVTTGTTGTASVYLKPSGSAGILNQVQAQVTSGTAIATVTFSATTQIVTTGSLIIVGGNNQVGRANEYISSPLTVEVRSGTAGTLQIGAPVTYFVTSGSGKLSTQFGGTAVSGTLALATGSNGRAQAYFRQAADESSTISVTSGTSVVTFTSTLAGNGAWSAWSFGDGFGVTAKETTGLGADGALTNSPVWSAGFDGNGGIEFSGSNSYVTMSGTSTRSLDLATDDFTVAFWVRYTEVPGSSETFRIVSKGFENFGQGYFVGLRGDGKLAAGVGATSGTSSAAVLFKTTGSFNDGEWHHVGVVVDRANATSQIYVDGTARSLEKEAGTGGTVTAGTLSLAGLSSLSASGTGAPFTVSSFSGSSQFFTGEVDEVKVYKSALAAEAVDSLYNIDSDRNELPDWWEYKYFTFVGVDPDEDDDRDGLTNAEEYDQGSDPRDYYSQGETTITPVISLISGNGQTSGPDQFLAEPFVVEVLSGIGGTPLVNAPVVFTVTSGSGAMASTANGFTSTPKTVYTGTNGRASAWYHQGSAVDVTSTITAQAGASNILTFEAATLGTNSLVGHWKLDEGTGATVADSAPFVHTGTLVYSPAWQERFDGENSLVFSGSAHVATLSGTDVMLDFAETSFSVTSWVKTGTTPVAGRIVSKGNESANAGYYLALNAQGQIETSLGTTQSGTASETIRIKTTGSFNDDMWHAVAAVYDRRTSTAKIYVDGTIRTITKEAGSGGTINVSGSTQLDYTSLQNLDGSRMGVPLTVASESGTNAFFQGGIDEVRVYRKALSAAEVLDLYEEEGELIAKDSAVTVAEDTLGTIALETHGGGDPEPTYEIIDEPTNGEVELAGAVAKYYANAHFSGTDGFRFRVTKGPNTAEADVSITITPVNDEPLVSVGGGQSVTMSGTMATLVLSGTVTDIDTDLEDISLTWMKTSGTGTVTFNDTNSLAATATFNAPGDYVLCLSANDGTSTRSDSLTVSVNPSGTNAMPTVSLVEPTNNTAYDEGEAVVLKASASAGAGLTISKVEFYEGSRKIAEVFSPNTTSGYYEFTWIPPRLGAYLISAKAVDNSGAKKFSAGLQVRVTDEGWFADPGTVPGNEGRTGSGGNGGITGGSSTGSNGNHGPGTGGNGGGGSAGGGGDGAGNPKGTDLDSLDSDNDGLSDAKEDEIGTNKFNKKSDSDDIEDGKDALPLDGDFQHPRIPESRYVAIRLPQGNWWGLNNQGTVIGSDENGEPAKHSLDSSLPQALAEYPREINDQGLILSINNDGDLYQPHASYDEALPTERPWPDDDFVEADTSAGIPYITDFNNSGAAVGYAKERRLFMKGHFTERYYHITAEFDEDDDGIPPFYQYEYDFPHPEGHVPEEELDPQVTIISSVEKTRNPSWYTYLSPIKPCIWPEPNTKTSLSINLPGGNDLDINFGGTGQVTAEKVAAGAGAIPTGFEEVAVAIVENHMVGFMFGGSGSEGRISWTFDFSNSTGLDDSTLGTQGDGVINDNGDAVVKITNETAGSFYILNPTREDRLAYYSGTNSTVSDIKAMPENTDLIGLTNNNYLLLWSFTEEAQVIVGNQSTILLKDMNWKEKPFASDLVAGAINARCEVILSDEGEGYEESVLWRNDNKYIPLSTITSNAKSVLASDLNDKGSIVGWADFGDRDGVSDWAPALLFPFELETRDRGIYGSVLIPSGWEKITLKFTASGKDLGTYALTGTNAAHIYDSEEAMFSDDEVEGYEKNDAEIKKTIRQKVTFIRDGDRIKFVTVSDDLGTLEISILSDNKEIASVKHELTADKDFERVIAAVEGMIAGDDPPEIRGWEDYPTGSDIEFIPAPALTSIQEQELRNAASPNANAQLAAAQATNPAISLSDAATFYWFVSLVDDETVFVDHQNSVEWTRSKRDGFFILLASHGYDYESAATTTSNVAFFAAQTLISNGGFPPTRNSIELPAEIRNRGLVSKALIWLISNAIKGQIAMSEGAVFGIWDGIVGDVDGVIETLKMPIKLWEALRDPYKTAGEIFHAFKTVKDMGWEGVKMAISDMIGEFVGDQEDRLAILLPEECEDPAFLSAYFVGYTGGFVGEQVAVGVLTLGAGKVGWIGKGLAYGKQAVQKTLEVAGEAGSKIIKTARGVAMDFGRCATSVDLLRSARQGASICDSPFGCLAEGTLVVMEDFTLKRIQDIVAGDRVISLNPAHPNGYSVETVKTQIMSGVQEVWRIGWDSNADGKIDDTLKVSAKHPVYIVGKGWTDGDQIKLGDMLLTYGARFARVQYIEALEGLSRTYNLDVTGWSTFLVTSESFGSAVLVHNFEGDINEYGKFPRDTRGVSQLFLKDDVTGLYVPQWENPPTNTIRFEVPNQYHHFHYDAWLKARFTNLPTYSGRVVFPSIELSYLQHQLVHQFGDEWLLNNPRFGVRASQMGDRWKDLEEHEMNELAKYMFQKTNQEIAAKYPGHSQIPNVRKTLAKLKKSATGALEKFRDLVGTYKKGR